MRRNAPAIFVCLLCAILLAACRTQPSLPDLRKTAPSADAPVYNANGSPAATGRTDTVKYDSLLTRLLLLENAVYGNPRDFGFITRLIKASFDSSSGCFIVAGKGAANTSLPGASWKQGRKIASNYDAKRWALYCKTWSLGSAVTFGTKISGEITYSSTLLERLDGDTLFSLVSVPTGSIIEK